MDTVRVYERYAPVFAFIGKRWHRCMVISQGAVWVKVFMGGVTNHAYYSRALVKNLRPCPHTGPVW